MRGRRVEGVISRCSIEAFVPLGGGVPGDWGARNWVPGIGCPELGWLRTVPHLAVSGGIFRREPVMSAFQGFGLGTS